MLERAASSKFYGVAFKGNLLGATVFETHSVGASDTWSGSIITVDSLSDGASDGASAFSSTSSDSAAGSA